MNPVEWYAAMPELNLLNHKTKPQNVKINYGYRIPIFFKLFFIKNL